MKLKFWLLCIAINAAVGLAQPNTVRMSCADSFLASDRFGRIATSIELENTTDKEWSGVLILDASSDGIGIHSARERNIVLGPFQKIYVPVMAQVSHAALLTKKPKIYAVLNASDYSSRSRLEIDIHIPEDRRVLGYAVENKLQYRQQGDTLLFRVHVANKGNTTEELQFVLHVPVKNEREKTVQLNFQLKPHRDTLLTVEKRVEKELFALGDFETLGTLLYANGDFVNRMVYAVHVLKDKRKYRNENRTDSNRQSEDNRIEFNQISGKHIQTSYQLAGKQTLEFSPNTKLDIRGDLNYWSEEQRLSVRQFTADFQHRTAQVQLGNIYQNGEFSLQGRGVQVAFQPDDSLQISTGAVDKSYSIIDPLDRSYGYNIWAGFDSRRRNWTHSSLYYDSNTRNDERKALWYNTYQLFDKQNIKFLIHNGVSNTRFSTTDRLGMLTGIIGSVNFNTLQFHTNSLISSPYYAGIRQGTTQLMNSLVWRKNKKSVRLSHQYMKNNPKYIHRTYMSTHRVNHAVGLHYAFRTLYNYWSLGVRFASEQRENYRSSEMVSLQAWRANLGFSRSDFVKQFGLNATLDIGRYNRIAELEKILHFKAYLGVNYKAWDLGVSYQYNYDNLSEIINSGYQEQDVYENILVTTNYRKRFFNERLGVQMSMYYIKNNNLNLWQTNGRIEYRLNPYFELYANTYATLGGIQKNLQTLYFQLGVVKKLGSVKTYLKHYNLTVKVYYRNENNDVIPASDKIVQIGTRFFVTNSEGLVTYNRLPQATYTIRVENDQNWFGTPLHLFLNQDTTQVIYLTQTTTIKGQISYEEVKNSYEIAKPLAGQKIIASDESGNSYTTYTSESGHYVFYLPKGCYNLTLYPDQSAYFTVLNNGELIDTSRKGVQVHEFKIRVKEKKVERKKFETIKF